MDYVLKPVPGLETSCFDWAKDPFYTTAIVLGIDIGIEGIGVWLRKGRKPIYMRTFLFNTPEAAPLRGRRLLRGGRRCRQSEQHREVLLKQFCSKFGLPWTEIRDEENEEGPFKLRLRAVRSKLASKEALVVCLRHIIKHRGYDYHETDGGSFPWGDELKVDAATSWAKAAYCSPEDAEEILHSISDSGWNDKQMASFSSALNAAKERHKQGIDAALEKHFAQAKNNLRIPARKHNFPRSLVWEHMEKICRNQTDLFGNEILLVEALTELKAILNYHRKKPGALADRKVNRCPIANQLFGGVAPKCDANSNAHIRRFKLLEFLATRSFVIRDGARVFANADLMKWLLDELLAGDIRIVEANKIKGSQKQERRKFAGFRGEFINKFDSTEKTELASDKVSHNKDFFDQLVDLLRPGFSVLTARASLCGKSAEELFKRAVKDGYRAETISRNLKEKQFNGQSFYTLRQAAAAGFGVYPQVEFLLGRRSKKGKQALPGILRQIFELPEILAQTASQKIPDYVIIETVGDMPRNLDQAKDIQEEQKRRRKFKEELFTKFKVHDQNQNAEARKRVLLYDQQGGNRGEAICPYTGKSLGDSPLSPSLEIDHIFPESRGGISEMVNLVLTHGATNSAKGNLTPFEKYDGAINSPQWGAIVDRMQKMSWNKAKRELVLRSESSCPEWENMTRMAQLARQLREEAARWLGVFGDDARVREKIGTPTGYQTSVCRESWSENLPDDFYPRKNRNNLRHHLWDAAIISHIPPGKGLNLRHCAGIFFHAEGRQHGNINMRALPGLGPDLKTFEGITKDQCLVEKFRTTGNKKQRFDQTIYSPPDKTGYMWARDSLDSLAEKPDLLKRLRVAGIDEKQLPDSRFEAWQERRDAQFFTREEARAAAEAIILPLDCAISDAIFDEWWNDRLSGDKKKVTDKSLRALLSKARIPKDAVTDHQLGGVLLNRGNPGSLTCKDGTLIHGVSGVAKQMAPMAVIPHRNHKGESIGFKLAKESFRRAEIWVTEKCGKKGEVLKDKEGKPELEFHRRLIPHPRGLKNLRLRVMNCTRRRLEWTRWLTDEEIVELGLKDHPEVKRLKREHEKALKQYAKQVFNIKSAGRDLLSGRSEAITITVPVPPAISLRKIYTGLPLRAKRLVNANGADISRFSKGDLLQVPVDRSGAICKPSQPVYREIWYRITAINNSGQVEMQLAEFKQIKRLSEKELEEGKSLQPEQEWLAEIFQQQPASNAVIAFLLQRNRADDQPSYPID